MSFTFVIYVFCFVVCMCYSCFVCSIVELFFRVSVVVMRLCWLCDVVGGFPFTHVVCRDSPQHVCCTGAWVWGVIFPLIVMVLLCLTLHFHFLYLFIYQISVSLFHTVRLFV